MRYVRIHADDGVTLTELMVAVFLLVVVSAVFLPTMISGMNATDQITNVARSNDDGRLALQRIDREVRAAEIICSPAPGYQRTSPTQAGTRSVIQTWSPWSQPRPGGGLRG